MAGMSGRTVCRPHARRLGAISVALVAFALLCGSAGAAGGSGVITVGGQIGKLQIDKSVRADVIAFAGTPDAQTTERVLGFANYNALGYDCSTTETAANFPIGNSGPYCATVFFLDVPHKTLEDFVTTSAAYHEKRGVRIGTSVSVAQRLFHTKVNRSCLVVLQAQSQTAKLRINFTRGKADTFVVHSLKRSAGLFHCTA
jgi:hypothetical protein